MLYGPLPLGLVVWSASSSPLRLWNLPQVASSTSAESGNAALHPLAYFGLSSEIAHRTIVRVVVCLVSFEVDTEDRTFAIFLRYKTLEL